ncbi:hypothetical protein GCM10023115_35730 [Pontixanthobacter gangjinensis]|uniref:Uncharacterized protein n=1 Tax=Christiangramia aestuarii TaxID=1028746 RepID=A0A7K1LS10_9FLAO|nr:hypothetical protein [Christiangramia aestuarii]MUP43260.1 hypothetical protein [Christiangramia aestuarii]
MTYLKNVFSEYNFAPKHQVSSFFNRNLKLSSLVVIFLLFSSCNPVALVNPDSYGDKWDNTYLWFKPGQLNTIYVSDTADPATAEPIPNDSDFLIEWSKKEKVYNLKVTSYYTDIDFAWFTGYDADSSSEEIPWVHDGNTIELQSVKLLEPSEDGGMYRISISDDLKD